VFTVTRKVGVFVRFRAPLLQLSLEMESKMFKFNSRFPFVSREMSHLVSTLNATGQAIFFNTTLVTVF
jgi:hypothetical protein